MLTKEQTEIMKGCVALFVPVMGQKITKHFSSSVVRGIKNVDIVNYINDLQTAKEHDTVRFLQNKQKTSNSNSNKTIVWGIKEGPKNTPKALKIKESNVSLIVFYVDGRVKILVTHKNLYIDSKRLGGHIWGSTKRDKLKNNNENFEHIFFGFDQLIDLGVYTEEEIIKMYGKKISVKGINGCEIMSDEVIDLLSQRLSKEDFKQINNSLALAMSTPTLTPTTTTITPTPPKLSLTGVTPSKIKISEEFYRLQWLYGVMTKACYDRGLLLVKFGRSEPVFTKRVGDYFPHNSLNNILSEHPQNFFYHIAVSDCIKAEAYVLMKIREKYGAPYQGNEWFLLNDGILDHRTYAKYLIEFASDLTIFVADFLQKDKEKSFSDDVWNKIIADYGVNTETLISEETLDKLDQT